jgi:V8-like Glu-specific endopeptidase
MRMLHVPALGLLAATAAAQNAPIPSELRPRVVNSGTFDNSTHQVVVAWQDIVHVPGAPWLRFKVDAANLPLGSFLEVTSALDGHTHLLDAEELRVWSNSSAYLNGDMLFVRLLAGPNTAGNRIGTSVVEVGLNPPQVQPASQCGPTDDRVPSTDPRTGRLVPVGCTAWLISPTNCFVTAGHCCAGTTTTVQFNVPPSSSGGAIVNPGPQDQYAVDGTSRSFESGGVGRDWCTFRTLRNATTSRHAGEVQGAFFLVSSTMPVPPRTIRITGYGVDSDTPTRSQTNQTHAGPQQTHSNATALGYQTDTTGGNSGSPVIDETTGHAIGVHTHGGCTTSGTGYNSGTKTTYAPFLAALQASACAGATPAAYGTFGAGCAGSNGVDTLSATGTPKLGASFNVNLTGGAASSFGVQFFGVSNTTWLAIPLPFAIPGSASCSLLCSGEIMRAYATSAAGGASVVHTVPSDPSLIGGVVFHQNVTADGAAPVGVTTSNGGRGTFGTL